VRPRAGPGAELDGNQGSSMVRELGEVMHDCEVCGGEWTSEELLVTPLVHERGRERMDPLRCN
jgi:hypothetical protein